MRIWEKLRGILCRLGLLPSETGIFYIGSSIVLPPPLTAQQEAEAVRGFQQGSSLPRSAHRTQFAARRVHCAEV